ncbi:MAG: DUF1343 domain-containing protein [Verrucomicrobia bacterium]|nr:DUF1343 domain-containing protein [Verrucomicrobiota bacterium]
MNRIASLCSVLLASAVFFGCKTAPKQSAAACPPAVQPGVDVLFEKRLDLLRGKRVGLITNPTGVDRNLGSIIERFRQHPDLKLVALYGPEHGVRGNAQAGEYVAFYLDPHFQLPVFSLYGQSKKPPVGMLKNIDEYMRSFDTSHADKTPEKSMLQAIDVMVFDLQDVGARVYTYIATMAYAMQACAEGGIPFVVLDRPNPITGEDMEGAMLDYPKLSSFVGLYPIPLRHGMTAGELARLFNDKFLPQKANLIVVPAEGWKRDQWFDETGLPWVIPSPNLPTLEAAVVYPGQVLFEGTNLSEGRGTTRPFELFGAPWIDGYDLAKDLNALGLPGVKFREAWFTPTFSKHQGKLCGGCQLHVTDRRAYRSVATTLHIIRAIKKRYPAQFEFHAAYFDKVAGAASVRTALESGEPVEAIVSGFKKGLDDFGKLRLPYLLYR